MGKAEWRYTVRLAFRILTLPVSSVKPKMTMDLEKVVIVVLVTVALGLGGFILWGPPERRRRRTGRIGGLVNLGYTCFLNTLLQALAACPAMVEWLSQQDASPDSLVRTLKDVLLVLNGQHPVIDDDPFTPSDVIKSLTLKGWVISPGEQDAHELFHVVMTTLEEEAQSGKSQSQVLSISDALEGHLSHGIAVPRRIQSEHGNIIAAALRNSRDTPLVSSCPAFHLGVQAPPFQGLLTSQLQCVVCKYKSAVIYDKFDSLSLHLPSWSENVFTKKITLQQLLEKFVSTEVVKDVSCEKCNLQQDKNNKIKGNAKKTLKFGKLPKCLCFHIQRTIWERNGEAYKRYDHVEFPEYLSMDDYTFFQGQKQMVPVTETATKCDSEKNERRFPSGNFSVKHLYKLTGVIVHSGNLDAGHFMTYRRAPLRDKWYYTSDSEVRESSLREVMQSCAYMLFYSKCVRIAKSL